jgi:uncharacterized protein (DUF302 family)
MIHRAWSSRGVSEVAGLLPAVVAKHGFGAMNSTDLRRKMAEKGVPFDHDCVVFDVCNPGRAKAVLERDMRVSTVLPCRISVYEDQGKTVLAAVKPTTLLGLFGTEGLREAAEEVERTIVAIIDEAAAA